MQKEFRNGDWERGKMTNSKVWGGGADGGLGQLIGGAPGVVLTILNKAVTRGVKRDPW